MLHAPTDGKRVKDRDRRELHTDQGREAQQRKGERRFALHLRANTRAN